MSPVCDSENQSQLRRTDSSLGHFFSSRVMWCAVTPRKPLMVPSVQMSAVTDTNSVFSRLLLTVASLIFVRSWRHLSKLVLLTGLYLLSTTDMKVLKWGSSTKDRSRLQEMIRSCTTAFVTFFYVGWLWLYIWIPVLLKNESMLLCAADPVLAAVALVNSENLE